MQMSLGIKYILLSNLSTFKSASFNGSLLKSISQVVCVFVSAVLHAFTFLLCCVHAQNADYTPDRGFITINRGLT